MAYEHIALVVDGQPWEGWESCVVEQDAKIAFMTFVVSTVEIGATKDVFEKWRLAPGTIVELYASGSRMMIGRIYTYAPTVDAYQHSVTIGGTTMGRAWAESSVMKEPAYWENTTDTAIFSELAGLHGCSVEIWTDSTALDRFAARIGGSNYQEVMRMFTQRGKMITARNGSGVLAVIGRMPFGTHTGILAQGHNIIRMSAKLSDARYHIVKAVGQNSTGTSLQEHFQPKGIAEDGGADSNRRLIVVDQLASKSDGLQTRAFWEMMRWTGAATECTITVPGWRDIDGKFWEVNMDVYVNAKWLQIDCLLRISKVVFKQSKDGGTTTDITVVDRRALGGETFDGQCNSGPLWSQYDYWRYWEFQFPGFKRPKPDEPPPDEPPPELPEERDY